MESFEDSTEPRHLSLRDRMPDYLTVFGVGLAACAGIGVVIWLISDVALAPAIGYTCILYGVVFLLAGGATGGGYTNLGVGAAGALFGTRRADEAEDDVSSTGGFRDPVTARDRLQRGLRPEANPRAFWQVIGGATYIGLGLAVVVIGS